LLGVPKDGKDRAKYGKDLGQRNVILDLKQNLTGKKTQNKVSAIGTIFTAKYQVTF
jgi:hypothetical protein